MVSCFCNMQITFLLIDCYLYLVKITITRAKPGDIRLVLRLGQKAYFFYGFLSFTVKQTKLNSDGVLNLLPKELILFNLKPKPIYEKHIELLNKISPPDQHQTRKFCRHLIPAHHLISITCKKK